MDTAKPFKLIRILHEGGAAIIDKVFSVKHSGINLSGAVGIHYVLFGFMKDPASHLDRRGTGTCKCRERQDAESDFPSIHSNGYVSSGDHPKVVGSNPVPLPNNKQRYQSPGKRSPHCSRRPCLVGCYPFVPARRSCRHGIAAGWGFALCHLGLSGLDFWHMKTILADCAVIVWCCCSLRSDETAPCDWPIFPGVRVSGFEERPTLHRWHRKGCFGRCSRQQSTEIRSVVGVPALTHDLWEAPSRIPPFDGDTAYPGNRTLTIDGMRLLIQGIVFAILNIHLSIPLGKAA